MEDLSALLAQPIVKIAGAARTGKTQVLADHAARLVDGGCAPESILIVASTQMAVAALRSRLAAATGDDAAGRIVVATPLQVCAHVLAAPEAQAFCGRVPRLVTSPERKFLMEDLITCGLKARTLRSMFRFFCRKWEDGEPQEAWIERGEMAEVLDLLTGKLARMGSMLPEEAAYFAARYLTETPEARGAFAHVLIDDFQNLSHAQQTACCQMTRTQLVVAGNANETVAVATDWPYPEGFADFEEVRHGVAVAALDHAFGDPAVQAFANALVGAEGMDAAAVARSFDEPAAASDAHAADRGIVSVKWASPEMELNGATKYLRAVCDARPEEGPCRTYVVVPNRKWAKSVDRILRGRGFRVSAAGAAAGIGGDPRTIERCPAMRAYTKLNLLARPDDLQAWRCWHGYGDYLMGSAAWLELEKFADTEGIDLAAALTRVVEGTAPNFPLHDKLAARHADGLAFIAANRERRGFALLRAIGADKLFEFEALSCRMAGDETAEELYAMMSDAVDDPVYPAEDVDVRVTTIDRLCGLDASRVVVLGAVNGFFPARDAFEVVSTDDARARETVNGRRAFYAGVAKADDLLVLSHFGTADLELAERTKMKVARVRSGEDGERVALVEPSRFLDDAAALRPETQSGQALLSAYQLA